MSASVDERVVKLTFDNNTFEKNIAQSRDSLGRFTQSLQLTGATKGLTDVSAAAKSVSLGNIASGVDSIANKFKAMSIIGITALSNIASKAVDVGLRVVKALTIDPVMAGFQNYETQINATQTILANTAAAGTKIGDVNKVLAELNKYANQTVYNFSDMTKNIGTFTAAGVGLQASVNSIKGIANLAAMSGATSEQASTAMYQLSQAIAAGSVKLQDWNSVVNAGLGGKTFQTALVNTARASGTNIDAIIKKAGSFRASLEKGWLTSNVLTKTLSQFTGDLSLAQIKAMGYTDDQAKKILAMSKVAVDSATKIKTATQLADALKEEVATAWAAIFKTVFGGIGQATTLFSSIHNIAEAALTNPIYALNTLIQGVDKLGGRAHIVDTVKNVFAALGRIITPISQAFHEIFPPATAAGIEKIIVAVDNFSKKLKIGGDTAGNLERTFAGLFAAIGIGWDVVKKVAGVIGSLFSSATAGSGSILLFTARIGDWVVKLKTAIEEGTGFNNFFVGLTKYLQLPITLLKTVASYVGSLFDKLSGAKVAGAKAEQAIDGVTKKLGPLGVLGTIVAGAWAKVLAAFPGIEKAFEPLAKKLTTFFSQLGTSITSALGQMDFSDVLNTIDTGLFAGVVLLFKKFVGKIGGGGGNAAGGLLHAITESFDELTNTLHTMQGTLKAATLLEIAAAIGILTISVSVLARIDSEGLKRSLTAMAAMFTELLASMAVFQKVVGTVGFAKIPIITAAMILLAIAVDLLTIAVTRLAKLDWAGLSKGLVGVAALLGSMVVALRLMPPSASVISTAAGLVILAAAIKILVTAVAALSGFTWTELAKGLTGVGALLVGLALFTKFAAADAGGIAQGAGIVLLATGIKILVSSMKDFGSFSWTEIAKSLIVLAGSLVLIGAALVLIPPNAPLSAAGVVVMAGALLIIGKAVQQMGSMSWMTIAKGLVTMAGAIVLIVAALILIPPTSLLSAAAVAIVASALGLIADALEKMGGFGWIEIAKSLIVLAGSLTIITVAMILMTEALPGAAALLVVAAALQVLAPVLKAFGDLSWTEMGKSLLMLAGVFVILGVAGLVLTPLVPTLIGLGIAVTLLGIGMIAAGAGVLLFSTGLTALAVSGAAGAAAIVGIVSALLGLLPVVVKQLGATVIAFATAIGAAGPAILKAITTVLDALITAIGKYVPKIVNTLLSLLTQMLQALQNYVPKMVVAGLRLITGVLTGIGANEGKLITAAATVVVNFLNGISANLPRVIDAGVKLVISFVNGVANAIRGNSAAMGAAGENLGSAVITGMIEGMAGGIGQVSSAAENVAKSAINAAKRILDSHSPSKVFIQIGKDVVDGFAIGLKGNKGQVDAAFNTLKSQLSTAVQASNKDIAALDKSIARLTKSRNADTAEIAKQEKELTKARASGDTKKVDSLEASIAKLTKSRNADTTEIAKLNAAVVKYEKEIKAENAAYKDLTVSLASHKAALDKLGTQYDALTTKVTNAKTALTNAQKVLTDYNAQVTAQYGTLTAPTADSSVSDYIQGLKTQVEQTKEYENVLQRLRTMGLNDETFKQLTDAGISDLPFAQALLAGGKSAVDQINGLGTQLTTAGKTFGSQASTDLYQAAVNAAAGLVKGLESQQAAIQKEMDKIADAMVASIKKKLGIKSPSTVFAEVGGYSAQGLAQGLTEMSGVVEDAAAVVGVKAVASLSKSLSGISDMLTTNMNIQPTITPVLDLSGVKKDAGQLGTMLQSQSLTVQASYAKATNASAGYISNTAASAAANTAAQSTSKATAAGPTFNQYNNSPAALSTADIYRQTKNQLSTARGFYVYQGGSQ